LIVGRTDGVTSSRYSQCESRNQAQRRQIMDHRKKILPYFHCMICLHDDSVKPCKQKNSVINLAVINCIINRRNRRESNSLSPIFYLFLVPSGRLYLKVQHLLAADETAQSSNPPLLKHRRPGPKHPAYSIPASKWPTVLQRVVEQKEPLRTVAAAYSVSHETIRRLIRAATSVHVQQEAQRSHLS